MKKKTVQMLLSLAVLAVLGGTYVVVRQFAAAEEASEAEQDSEEEETTNVLSIDTDQVQSLKFMIEKKEVTFTKEDDVWVKEDEKEFPVNQDTLDSAVSAVSSVDAQYVLEDVEDLAEYDLDSPVNTITITDTDGQETVVRVGMKNDSSQYYVSKDDDRNTVYLISGSAITPFMKDLYNYAEEGSFPEIDSSLINQVKVEKTDSEYELAMNEEDGYWYIQGNEEDTQFEQEKSDTSKGDDLTSEISSLSYDSFVDYNNTDDSAYGFDNPYAVITVEYQEEVLAEEDEDTDVEDTDAEEADVEEVDAEDTDAEEADVEEVDVEDTDAEDTDVEEADVEDTDAEEADVEEADAEEADVEEADVEDTDVEEADVEEADVEDTDAEEADVEEADVEDTDVEETDVEDTDVEEVDTEETDVSEDTEDEEEETVEYVDKELVIYIGNVTDNDTRYVKIDDSKEVYTISTDSLDSIIEKNVPDFWSMIVYYQPSSNLDELEVTKDGETSKLYVSRETSEDEDGNETETTTYLLDGTEVDSLTFSSFYNKLINISGQERLTEDYEPENDPNMIANFTSVDGEKQSVAFYEYDVNFYAVGVENKTYLVNKMTVKELYTAYEDLTEAAEETVESDEEVTEESEESDAEATEETEESDSESVETDEE
jgi:hypothetical protein